MCARAHGTRFSRDAKAIRSRCKRDSDQWILDQYSCKMDSVEATLVTLSLVLLLRKQPKRRQRKQRQYWMHPFNTQRLLCGHHVTTFKQLKNYDLKFKSCYRMSYSTFCELLSR
uniref:Orf1 n=1 Tax=Galleria mellonella nuclear polyhedrosis virus TaxID=307468 RepID=Q86983_NPVGM|nr:Orf1 [Galleria mellonella MNPV]